MTLHIRPSQFITTFGPGSILETTKGPRVAKDLQLCGLFDTPVAPGAAGGISDFEVVEPRLSAGLLGGRRLFRLPTNDELRKTPSESLYRTASFPSWSLCRFHQVLYTYENGRGCPDCSGLQSTDYLKSRRESIRFVLACGEGHLDDAPWDRLIKHKGSCGVGPLEWRGSGAALRNIEVICRECGGSTNLGYEYSRDHVCSGRFPERGPDRPGCSKLARMIQRGASNIRVSDVVAALTIPPRVTPLHRALELEKVRTVLDVAEPPIEEKNRLLDLLSRLVARGHAPPWVLEEVRRADSEDVTKALREAQQQYQPMTEEEFRAMELDALKRAAVEGAPLKPYKGRKPVHFEVVLDEVCAFSTGSGGTLRVTPVSRLRVVVAQRGFRRFGATGSLVDTVFTDEAGTRWYPCAELLGEGLFIDLGARGSLPLEGAATSLWKRSGHHQPGQPTPGFVWWHTLSHRLLTAISVDSGYSAASLGERVYAKSLQDGSYDGGVLIFATQSGSEGTLGGLLALAPIFSRVLEIALRELDSCSNDPLCGEQRISKARVNGAACYACLLVSETSCEHRNASLDRNVLLENPA